MFDTLNTPSLLGDFCTTELNVAVVGKVAWTPSATLLEIKLCVVDDKNFLTVNTLKWTSSLTSITLPNASVPRFAFLTDSSVKILPPSSSNKSPVSSSNSNTVSPDNACLIWVSKCKPASTSSFVVNNSKTLSLLVCAILSLLSSLSSN